MLNDSSRDKHLLRGAVGKRKKKVLLVMNEQEMKATSESETTEGTGKKRKGFLSRIFGNKSRSKKIGHAPDETPGSHYVKV